MIVGKASCDTGVTMNAFMRFCIRAAVFALLMGSLAVIPAIPSHATVQCVWEKPLDEVKPREWNYTSNGTVARCYEDSVIVSISQVEIAPQARPRGGVDEFTAWDIKFVIDVTSTGAIGTLRWFQPQVLPARMPDYQFHRWVPSVCQIGFIPRPDPVQLSNDGKTRSYIWEGKGSIPPACRVGKYRLGAYVSVQRGESGSGPFAEANSGLADLANNEFSLSEAPVKAGNICEKENEVRRVAGQQFVCAYNSPTASTTPREARDIRDLPYWRISSNPRRQAIDYTGQRAGDRCTARQSQMSVITGTERLTCKKSGSGYRWIAGSSVAGQQSVAEGSAAKVCPAAQQQKLRASYQALASANSKISGFLSKLKRAQTLQNVVGPNGTIQLSPSEFSESLGGFPVLGGTRQVPVRSYIAVLNGAIEGTREGAAPYFAKAKAAYAAATAGCKKVVGPPPRDLLP